MMCSSLVPVQVDSLSQPVCENLRLPHSLQMKSIAATTGWQSMVHAAQRRTAIPDGTASLQEVLPAARISQC